MPLHEFICRDCAHQFEEILRNYDPDLIVQCPQCDSTKIEKLVSLTGGYYIMGNNGASTRPRSAGAPKRSKA